ncbi:SDR family NAD(P)-dependent oxidoreductase [Nonomuraea jabiensis]|uniref:SDR family NAD(P)-dependent oxidoreductase n=1 Tax=Nonomuraea jabiensis TaxID=882448 RepID=UPI003D749A56
MPTTAANSPGTTWFITGTSQAFRLELVKQLLAGGHRVAATARLRENLGEDASSDLFLPLQVDLAYASSIDSPVHRTVEYFGSIDVLVNNAGHGLLGSVEETSDAAALPQMRAQRRGRIINMSSIFGLVAGAGWGLYNATRPKPHRRSLTTPAPLRLLLGSDALRLATQKIENLAAGIEQNKKITLSTDVH